MHAKRIAKKRAAKQPAAEQPPAKSLDPLADIISVPAAAKLLKTRARVLYRLAEEGRIPFVERVGKRWVLCAKSLKFLHDWYSPAKRAGYRFQKGVAPHDQPGHQAIEQMKQAAAKLDAACLARQKTALPQYWRNKQRNKAVS